MRGLVYKDREPSAMGNHPQSWHHLHSASPNLAWPEASGEVSTLQHPLWVPRVPNPSLSLVPGDKGDCHDRPTQ